MIDWQDLWSSSVAVRHSQEYTSRDCVYHDLEHRSLNLTVLWLYYRPNWVDILLDRLEASYSQHYRNVAVFEDGLVVFHTK